MWPGTPRQEAKDEHKSGEANQPKSEKREEYSKQHPPAGMTWLEGLVTGMVEDHLVNAFPGATAQIAGAVRNDHRVIREKNWRNTGTASPARSGSS